MENLRHAFFHEAGLAMRYLYFAVTAEYEGFERHAGLFRELAEGGTTNVHGLLDFLRTASDPAANVPIGNTSKNLQSVLQTETEQFAEKYPEMAKIAREEGYFDVASWFDTLEKAKAVHVKKLKRLNHDK